MNSTPSETFYQKTFSEKREYVLNDEGVELHIQNWQGEFRESFSFEQISRKNRQVHHRDENHLRFYQWCGRLSLVGLVFVAFGLVSIAVPMALFTSTLLFFLFYRLGGRHFILLETYDAQPLYFLKNRDSKQKELEKFLGLVYIRRDAYLRQRYFHVNRENTPEQEKQRLEWLRTEDVITPNEFEDAVFKLDFGFKL